MNENWQNVLLAAEHLAGFVIVIIALTVLWGLTALMGALVQRFGVGDATRAPSQSPPSPAAAASPSAPDDALSEEEVVVIAAAVATLIDGRHRVVSVRPVHSSWGQQGRREIHASHRIR